MLINKPLDFFDSRAKPVPKFNAIKDNEEKEYSNNDFDLESDSEEEDYKQDNKTDNESKPLNDKKSKNNTFGTGKSPDQVTLHSSMDDKPSYLKKVEQQIEDVKVTESQNKAKCLFLTNTNDEDLLDDDDDIVKISKPTPKTKNIINTVNKSKNLKSATTNATKSYKSKSKPKPQSKTIAKPKARPVTKVNDEIDIPTDELFKENKQLLNQVNSLTDDVEKKLNEIRAANKANSYSRPLPNERLKMK